MPDSQSSSRAGLSGFYFDSDMRPLDPLERRHGTPILFVHGMWHGAWCWEDFVRRFQELGYDARAMNLRDHDLQRRRPARVWRTLKDYVEDVDREAATFAVPPILVGHSLGCLLVEIVMARVKAPAAVLLAPTSHRIFRRSVRRFACDHPLQFLRLLVTGSLWSPVCSPKLGREMFFTPMLPEEEFRLHYARIQNESYLVATQLLLGLGPHPPPPQGIPTLVLGGQMDRPVRSEDVQEAARRHGVEPEFMPDVAHDMMIDVGRERVARRIADWLRSACPPRDAAGASST